MVPRAVIFAGKAAPGYTRQIDRQIHQQRCSCHQRDPDAQPWLRAVFCYRISAMEVIAPAADVSLRFQPLEASGTGNRKFMMNAVTVGTLDGANVEIHKAVGDENFIAFGMCTEDVQTALEMGHEPISAIAEDENLTRVIKLIESHHFNQFEPIHDDILNGLREPTTLDERR